MRAPALVRSPGSLTSSNFVGAPSSPAMRERKGPLWPKQRAKLVHSLCTGLSAITDYRSEEI